MCNPEEIIEIYIKPINLSYLIPDHNIINDLPYLELKANARVQNAVSPNIQREKKKKKKRKREKGRF